MEPISPQRYRKVVFLTGAGISASSGLSTYRGTGGVWEKENVAEVGTAEAIAADPVKVWKAFRPIACAVRQAEPNPAHLAITRFQQAAGEDNWVCVLTQNVDGLHRKAGTRSVLGLHGSLHRVRCTNCPRPAEELEIVPELPPECPDCGSPQRYDVVLFGEALKGTAAMGMMVAMEDCELFISVGTSGLVYPAAELVEQATAQGARTISVNLEHEDTRFQENYLGPAEELLPRLLGQAG